MDPYELKSSIWLSSLPFVQDPTATLFFEFPGDPSVFSEPAFPAATITSASVRKLIKASTVYEKRSYNGSSLFHEKDQIRAPAL